MKNARSVGIFILGVSLLATVVFLQGCPGVMGGGKSYSDMVPKEKATYLMSVYNQQYELYLREALIPDMTEEKKDVMRQKKKALTELYPYIGMYVNYAETGTPAPLDVEMAVMAIMDRLLGL